MADDVLEEGEIGGDSPDAELAQRPVHPLDGLVGRGRPGRHLFEERIVERRDAGARIGGAAVEAHAEAGRAAIGGQHAVVRNEVVFRILGGDPALQGMPVDPDFVLRRDAAFRAADPGAVRDPYLRLHQVDARDHLGDGVLDLDARIDLDEIERAGVGIDQELDRPRVVVADGAAELQRVLVHRGARRGVEGMRRRAFDDLLVAPLHRAVALVQVDEIAVIVAEDLHLDMARAADQLLQIDLVVAERGQAFAPRGLHLVGELGLVPDLAHAAPAAAPARLEHDRKTDLPGEAGGLVRVARQRTGGRDDRDAGGLRDFPGRHLVAELAHDFGTGADERDAGVGAGLGEIGVLRQETVARMDRVGPVLARHPKHFVDAEIGLDGTHAAADEIGLVGLEPVQREPVLLGIDRDGPDAELDRGAQRPNGDLAPVGDQDAAEPGLRLAGHRIPAPFSERSCVGRRKARSLTGCNGDPIRTARHLRRCRTRRHRLRCRAD